MVGQGKKFQFGEPFFTIKAKGTGNCLMICS